LLAALAACGRSGSEAGPAKPTMGDASAASDAAALDAGAALEGGGATVDPGVGPWPPSFAPSAPIAMDDVTVFAFSQVDTNATDPQVVSLAPDMNIRSWARWDTGGLQKSDYDFSYVTACQAAGVRFIGGTTATALFSDEPGFSTVVTVDASGNPVMRPNGMYRGSLADPDYRAYLVSIGKIQIDGGVDGLFFDEVNGDLQGLNGSGDEGFDDAHLADFNAFLLWKYPGADYQAMFGMSAGAAQGGLLRADVPPGDLTRNFDYRAYLTSHGWAASPFASANPLAGEWGQSLGNRPLPGAQTFTDLAEPYRYWQAIVSELRAYAQQTYARTIYITSNGVWPFVDFQSVGLYDYNQDGDGGTEAPYVPVTSPSNPRLDGTVSLKEPFLNLKARSEELAPGAPVVVFIDWPTTYSGYYFGFTMQEQEDYWRLYAAEAYANGLFFAFYLNDTLVGESGYTDETATTLGLMPFFTGLTAFYRTHAALYHGVKVATDVQVTTPLSAAMITVDDQAQPRRRLVHLVNHAYGGGILTQTLVPISISSSTAPTAVTLASPDSTAGDAPLPFTYAGGVVDITVPSLAAYAIVILAY
jgi:hypothetical protein